MRAVRRMVTAGLLVMAVVAVTAAIWPSVVDLIRAIFVTVLVAVVMVPAVVLARRARHAAAARQALRMVDVIDATTRPAAPPVIGPARTTLRESA